MLEWLKRLLRKPKPAAGPEPECGCGPDADVGPCPELTAACPVERPLEQPEVVLGFLAPGYADGLCDICALPRADHPHGRRDYESGYIHGKNKLVHEISDIAVVPYAPTGGYAREAVSDVLDALLQADANPHGDECDCPLCQTLVKLERQKVLRRRRRIQG